jgi:hypothetical protein
VEKSCKSEKNGQISSSLELNFDVRLSKKAPLCPYMRLPCLNFNDMKGRSVCQNKGNQFAESVRCSWLPSWVKDGCNLAVLRGGVLHV